MNREQYYVAIDELTQEPPTARLVLAYAMARMDTVQLGDLFDFAADTHETMQPRMRTYHVPLEQLPPDLREKVSDILSAGVDIDLRKE